MKDTIKKYLEKKSFYKPDEKNFSQNNFSEIAICIPVCNEYPTFMNTLKSISISCAVANTKVHVVCCVNNKINSSDEVLQNNFRMIYELNRIKKTENSDSENQSLLQISVLDFTKENAFTEKQGVGWARKISMDYALVHGAKVLACLDADTLVKENYVSELNRFYQNKMDCATMNFFHPTLDDENKNSEKINSAILSYENYIKNHSKKLAECGTPFYYSALGCMKSNLTI